MEIYRQTTSDDSVWSAIVCERLTVVHKRTLLEPPEQVHTQMGSTNNRILRFFELKGKLLRSRQSALFKIHNWKALYQPNDQQDAVISNACGKDTKHICIRFRVRIK